MGMWAYLTLFFPILGALAAGAVSSRVSQNLRAYFPLIGMGLSVFSVVPVVATFLSKPFPESLSLFDWIALGHFHIAWSLYIDAKSLAMVIAILFVSLPVHIYSLGYMKQDPHKLRFMILLSLFTFMMLFLVMAGTTIQFFVGWEGIGICSYLLIGFWTEKEGPKRASLKALLMNRWGDVFLLLGFVGIFWLYGTFSFDALEASFKHPLEGAGYVPSFVAWAFLMAAVVKSAQIGFHTWLADAMEGPTPVSALIHAATLVTAGVFLLLRFSAFLETVPIVLDFIILLGGITAVFGGVMALIQKDLKRIIAYSTCSQLGYMMVALGLKAHSAALFHLMTHAFFKSLLFLGAGCVIFCLKGEKDITKMAGRLPATLYSSVLIGFLSLTGMPFFAGFFSKEFIFEYAWHRQGLCPTIGFLLLLFGVFLTGLYSMRVFLRVFHEHKTQAAKNELTNMWVIPLIILAILSLLVGYLGKTILGYHLFFLPDPFSVFTSLSFVTVSCSLLGLSAGLWLYWPQSFRSEKIKRTMSPLYRFFVQYGSGDFFYTNTLAKAFRKITNHVLFVDFSLDHWGPLGTGRVVSWLHLKGRRIQTGYLYHYVGWILFGSLLLVAYGLWMGG
jgi:NADH-quinone oxidoreductase subunit L